MTFLSVALYLLLVGLMKIWSPSSIEVGIISTLQECYWVGLGGRLRAGSGIFSPHLLRIFAICCPHSPYISLPTLVSTRGGGIKTGFLPLGWDMYGNMFQYGTTPLCNPTWFGGSRIWMPETNLPFLWSPVGWVHLVGRQNITEVWG